MPQDRARAPYPSQTLLPNPTAESDPEGATQRVATVGANTYFLGRYRVVDEIGVGGMASVHLARMDGPGGFQKWVAIKRIHPHLLEDETFINMFLDEARVAARISHPNVATVFELGKHGETYWIAMEYLHGEPLREVMRRTEELGQPMPPEIACRVIADAAEGLHAAHELHGKNGEKLELVHRDVTPHNLFVTYDGSTKLVDFGIAKFSSRMAKTRAGTLKGKLAYMSPEQVAGEPIDRRTDVFAIGVVLWELTTGQRLFRMDNDLDTLAKVQDCIVPRPSSIVRGYPMDLEKVVLKALAKGKNERYGTARDLSRALQSLLMRRGLFIASDEVTAYMAAVFRDRIQKREAHLRWAADVTQTVDVAEIQERRWSPADGSSTYNSDVQASLSNTAQPGSRPTASPSAGRPGDQGRTQDLTTVTKPHRPPRAGPRNTQPSSFDDDFDEAGDTLVKPSQPEMEDFRRPTPAAGMLASGVARIEEPHSAGDTLGGSRHSLQRSQPVSNATAPAYDRRGEVDTERRTGAALGAAPEPVLAYRGALTPSTAYVPAGAASLPKDIHSPADVERLFAPPMGDRGTVTAQSLKRRLPLWAVALGSAVLGLGAFGLVLSILQPPRTTPPNVAGADPLSATRTTFASTSSASPPPPRIDSAASARPISPSPGPSFTSTLQAIPTTDIESLPVAPLGHGGLSRGGPSGTLKVICVPGCDQIIDNGSSFGPSPVVRRAPVGSHRIKLVWSDASTVVSTVVVADQTATVRENHP